MTTKNKTTKTTKAIDQPIIDAPITVEPVEPKAKKAKKDNGLTALPKLPRVRKPKPFVSCECGCGGHTRSRFCPGHDGRLYGWMLRIERGVCELKDIPSEGERAAVRKAMKATATVGTPMGAKAKNSSQV